MQKNETVVMSSWEIACIEYALGAAVTAAEKSGRKDIVSGSESALRNIEAVIAHAEAALKPGEKMNYTVELHTAQAQKVSDEQKTGRTAYVL
jgi:hypothetical protein